MPGEGDALMRGEVLTRRVLVNGSSLEELVRGHPVRTRVLVGEMPKRKGSLEEEGVFWWKEGPVRGLV